MRLSRVEVDGERWLARDEGETYVLLHRESSHPAADALREAISVGADLQASGKAIPRERARLLSPIANPSKLLAVALNYATHVDEAPTEARAENEGEPVVFAKTNNTIAGPEADVCVDSDITQQVDYEGELAVVIGRAGRDIPVAEALSHVFGYTVANDVSARDIQFRHKQWYRGKSFDGFAPMGPAVVTSDQIDDQFPLRIRTWVNGALFQDATTDQMIRGIAELIAFSSRGITLAPGDVILTGTPGGVGFVADPPQHLSPGDVVEVEITGIGRLRNTIV